MTQIAIIKKKEFITFFYIMGTSKTNKTKAGSCQLKHMVQIHFNPYHIGFFLSRSFNHSGDWIQLSFNISNCAEMSGWRVGLEGLAETVIKLPCLSQGFEFQFDLIFSFLFFWFRESNFSRDKPPPVREEKYGNPNNNSKVALHTDFCNRLVEWPAWLTSTATPIKTHSPLL